MRATLEWREPALRANLPSGARYLSVTEINANELVDWLDESLTVQWDYKNIVRRKGKLERLP